ncbi:hypothetical protein WDW89_06615 [Deltaproteobacteria bacterium TL4]
MGRISRAMSWESEWIIACEYEAVMNGILKLDKKAKEREPREKRFDLLNFLE